MCVGGCRRTGTEGCPGGSPCSRVARRPTPKKGKEVEELRAPRMSSTGSYRPEVWAYADQRSVRTGAGVPVDLGGPPNTNTNTNNSGNNNNNSGHAAGCTGADAYYDRHVAGYADECARPCTVPLTPRARWSPPQTSALYDQGQPATPDMALIIERLLDDLDREREARARAEGRTAVTATASSFTTTPTTTAAHALQIGPAGQPTTVLTQQTTQQQQQQQQAPQPQYLLPPPPNPAAVPPVVMVAPGAPAAPTGGLVGSGAPAGTNNVGATAPPSGAPPGTTSNRTLLLALIPILVVALLFAAWVVWRLSGIERRLTAVAAHAASTAPPPLVSPVVTPVVTAPAAPAGAPQRGGMLAVDTNNQYYYARPITS